MAVKIGHASIDEHGRARGGSAGDQTGREVCTRDWYNKPWGAVLRPKSDTLAEKSATACEKLCKCNLVGYDQYQRNTLYSVLKEYNYNVAKYIASKRKTETDCSAFMTICAIVAGAKKLVDYIKTNKNSPTTSTMVNAFKNTGQYTVLTDRKYTASSDYLKRGDILVSPGHHTAMALTNGPKADVKKKIDEKVEYKIGQKYTLQVDLNVRSNYSTTASIKKVFTKGKTIICKEIKAIDGNIWIKTVDGWLAAYYDRKLYIK